jgi:hypothetical protein
MAENTVKSGDGYTEDAEFRFIGNLFGALMACAGLLAGTMVREGLDYWLEDIVPLLLLVITMRGLIKSAMELAKDSIFYEEQKKQVLEALAKQEERAAAMAEAADSELPRIAAKPKYSEEEVLEAVSKRIEQQREEGLRKNKIIN